MPSPLGHALGGLTAGWLIDPVRGPWGRQETIRAACFAAAGMAADLDLLFGIHSGPTHGVGTAVAAAIVTFAATRRGRMAIACGAAYASHTLLDWLGSDTTAPIGIMALWPFSREYFQSSLHVFQAISRRYWLPDAWLFNARAVARELLILLPAAAAAGYFRRRR